MITLHFRTGMLVKLLALIALLCLQGCGDAESENSYFPLTRGYSWQYRVTTVYPNSSEEKILRIENIGSERHNDKTYHVRRTSTGIDYYLAEDDQGIYRAALRTLVENQPRWDPEPRFVLKYPLQTGTSWREISRPLILLRVFPNVKRVGEKSQIPMSYRIESINESVDVPAGHFENCIKVVAEGEIEVFTDAVHGMKQIPLSVEEWYAAGVGLVKQVRYEMDGESVNITDTPVFLGGHTSLELESFEY